MLSRYTDKNKYGGHTWKIELESLYHVFIHGTDTNSYVVEFKEWRWLGYKTHFTFVFDKDLRQTITESLNRAFDFTQDKPNPITRHSYKILLDQALTLLEEYYQCNPQEATLKIRDDGVYMARIEGYNQDFRKHYQLSLVLVFKGGNCITLEEDSLIEPAELNPELINLINENTKEQQLQYQLTGSNFSMRKYRSNDQWHEWTGKLINDGLLLSLNAHVVDFSLGRITDNWLYRDAHFKFIRLK